MRLSRKIRVVVAVYGGTLMATGCGGNPSAGSGPTSTSYTGPADETVEIRMVDLAFKPDAVTVKAGTTVRFVFKNDGQLQHEAAFGDEATQAAVGSGKQKLDGVDLGPNRTKDYVNTFSTPGVLIIGCHVPGHYEAGMKVRLTVA